MKYSWIYLWVFGLAMSSIFQVARVEAGPGDGDGQAVELQVQGFRGGGGIEGLLREGGTGKSLLIDENIDLALPVPAAPAPAVPAPAAPPPEVEATAPRNPCEDKAVLKGREAIEACRTASDHLECLRNLPDKEAQDGYALLCRRRDTTLKSGATARIPEIEGDAVQAASRVAVPIDFLSPCDCLEALKKLAPECNFMSCPSEEPDLPPVAEVPVPAKVQAPPTVAPNYALSGGGCFSSLVPAGELHPVGWMIWILPTVVMLLRRRHKE